MSVNVLRYYVHKITIINLWYTTIYHTRFGYSKKVCKVSVGQLVFIGASKTPSILFAGFIIINLPLQ